LSFGRSARQEIALVAAGVGRSLAAGRGRGRARGRGGRFALAQAVAPWTAASPSPGSEPGSPRSGQALIGAFETAGPSATARTPRTGTAVGAFETAAAGPPSTTPRAGVVVASAGFGSTRTDTTGSTRPQADVRPAGFDVARSAAPGAPRATPPPERVDVPVEILFKPTPVYTDEARRLKVEGDVLLDVEFAASGAVSVLQVVRGLGHGLDEAATTAARQIRFKPAQTSGRPITFRTTVHIVFRLA
jgi:TonB family protein